MPIEKLEALSAQRSGLLIAADVEDLATLDRLAVLCAENPVVVGMKIGVTLALRFGLPEVVRQVRSRTDKLVVYDHQKAGTDIPQMGGPFAAACSAGGVDAVIIFPHAGPQTMKAFVKAAADFRLGCAVGLVMTHEGFLSADGGFISNDTPHRVMDLSLELGVSVFVAPGNRPDVVRAYSTRLKQLNGSFAFMMPGIGSQGGTVRAAFEAAAPHNRYAIIGSAIYNAPEPNAAIARLAEEARQ